MSSLNRFIMEIELIEKNNRKDWLTNAGQRELDTKVQRALLEKLFGRKETFASKYWAAKAGHISAKGNGGKKINWEKRKH